MTVVVKTEIVDALKNVGLQRGDFVDIGVAFEASHTVNRAKLGGAEIKLMKQRELVDFAVEWIENNRK